MELQGQYLWSNRNASVEALLAAALSHPLFRDLTILAYRYGIDTLEQKRVELTADERLTGGAAEAVERMVRNIRTAMEKLGDA